MDSHGWRRSVHPRAVLAGTAVTLIVGTAGLVLTVVGALLGAVAGGATTAYLADDRLGVDVLHACAADVVSSLLFFVLVLVYYLAIVASEEGLALVSAAGVSFYYGLIGGTVAVPIGMLSLVIAALSAAVTSRLTA